MGLFRRRWVRRTGPDRYAVRLGEHEQALLTSLAGQLHELLTATTDDPNVRRLFPTAYHDDEERDREYQQLVRDELLERRLAALTTMAATVAAPELDEAALQAWMGAVNDLRLVLGTRLDIGEDDPAPGPDHPEAPTYAVYAYLTQLLDGIVEALAEGMGDTGSQV